MEELILGIDDPEKTKFKGLDRIFGIEENKELFDSILHEIKNIIPPMSNITHRIIEAKNKKSIALLNVPKATESFYSIDNQVWVRLRKSNKKLSPQEVVKFNYANSQKDLKKQIKN